MRKSKLWQVAPSNLSPCDDDLAIGPYTIVADRIAEYASAV